MTSAKTLFPQKFPFTGSRWTWISGDTIQPNTGSDTPNMDSFLLLRKSRDPGPSGSPSSHSLRPGTPCPCRLLAPLAGPWGRNGTPALQTTHLSSTLWSALEKVVEWLPQRVGWLLHSARASKIPLCWAQFHLFFLLSAWTDHSGLSNHPWRDVWVLPSLRQSVSKADINSCIRVLCELGKYLGVELLGHMTCMFNFIRSCQTGDFPGGPVGKTLCSQCRGPRFDTWSRN